MKSGKKELEQLEELFNNQDDENKKKLILFMDIFKSKNKITRSDFDTKKKLSKILKKLSKSLKQGDVDHIISTWNEHIKKKANQFSEVDIHLEAKDEFNKPFIQLACDSIREANARPKPNDEEFASEKENLDKIKHLIKRLAVHQVALDDKASKTNKILSWLAWFMGSISVVSLAFQIIAFFSK